MDIPFQVGQAVGHTSVARAGGRAWYAYPLTWPLVRVQCVETQKDHSGLKMDLYEKDARIN